MSTNIEKEVGYVNEYGNRGWLCQRILKKGWVMLL